jgi:hypothetical protein
MKRILLILLVLVFLAGCETPAWGSTGGGGQSTMTPSPVASPTISGMVTVGSPSPSSSSGSVVNTSPTPTMAPDAWKDLPIVPTVSTAMKQVYLRGIAAGRNPDRFSKVGDCQNITTYYLAMFDTPTEYSLGSQYAYLQPTIDQFSGSWSRESLAVGHGWNVAAVLNPFFADQKTCNSNESPLACEIRVYNPSILIVSMETWWAHKPATGYENYLRQVVEYALSQNVVPILATKADNLEGDYSINAAIARVAYDYQVPLWNFWAATDPLPSHGLTSDGFHLTQARSFFDDPVRMEEAWPWRNLTALQAIDAVNQAVDKKP